MDSKMYRCGPWRWSWEFLEIDKDRSEILHEGDREDADEDGDRGDEDGEIVGEEDENGQSSKLHDRTRDFHRHCGS